MKNGITASDYNFLDPKVRSNPYPYYEALRRESPIHPMVKGRPLFAVGRFKDVEYVLNHPNDSPTGKAGGIGNVSRSKRP